MKLHCPHCGVKGSAEDSYRGRKVQCPKCQGVFEVKPEMVSALTGDAPLAPEPSSASTESVASVEGLDAAAEGKRDFWEADDEQSAADEHTEAAVEVEKEPVEQDPKPAVAEEEETLEWDDIASEIDLQSADQENEEELEVDLEQSPAELSPMEDEYEQPAGDWAEAETELEVEIGFEEEVAAKEAEDLAEEVTEAAVETDEKEVDDESLKDIWAEWDDSPLLGPVDFGNPKEELAGEQDESADPVEVTDENGEEDEVPDGQERAEVELEPYGIEKEQCWQCGKKDNLGEPFITKDGRLYCADCAPAEMAEEAADTQKEPDQEESAETQPQDFLAAEQEIEATAATTAQFSIGGALSKAWAMTTGAKSAIWAGSAIMYLILLAIVAGGMTLLRTTGGDMSSTGLALNMLLPVIIDVCFVIFTAGLLLMGIKKVAGESISWKMIFAGFTNAGKIIVATILQSLLIGVGFLLLVLPGIYLAVGYVMTIPLIVCEGLSPWQAMEKSRKAVHKVWWRVLGLYILMSIIFSVSAIPLGIGLIWTWPMFLILAGVVYWQLFGADKTVE